jgi:hypothetical protein
MAKERKQASGIALRPSLWRRIKHVAETKDQSVNEVMEAVLDMYVPALPDFKNQRVNSPQHDDGEDAVELV